MAIRMLRIPIFVFSETILIYANVFLFDKKIYPSLSNCLYKFFQVKITLPLWLNYALKRLNNKQRNLLKSTESVSSDNLWTL